MVGLLVANDIAFATKNLSTDFAGERFALVFVFNVSSQCLTSRECETAVRTADRKTILLWNVLWMPRTHMLHQSSKSSELFATDVTRTVCLGLVQAQMDL